MLLEMKTADHSVGKGVYQERERRADDADERPGQRWTGHLRHRRAAEDFAVGRREVGASHQSRQIRRPRRLEEDAAQTRHQLHSDKKSERLHANERGDGDGGDHERATDVRGDHDRLAVQAVDPCPGDEAEQEPWQSGGGREDPHLERTRVEAEHGVERDRHEGKLGADLRDRPAAPEPDEILMVS